MARSRQPQETDKDERCHKNQPKKDRQRAPVTLVMGILHDTGPQPPALFRLLGPGELDLLGCGWCAAGLVVGSQGGQPRIKHRVLVAGTPGVDVGLQHRHVRARIVRWSRRLKGLGRSMGRHIGLKGHGCSPKVEPTCKVERASLLQRAGMRYTACQSPIEMSLLLPVRDVTTGLSNACLFFV